MQLCRDLIHVRVCKPQFFEVKLVKTNNQVCLNLRSAHLITLCNHLLHIFIEFEEIVFQCFERQFFENLAQFKASLVFTLLDVLLTLFLRLDL